MAEKVIKTRIQLKYDLYSNWTSQWSTFIPKAGEIVFFAIPTTEPNADVNVTGVNKPQTPPQILFKVGDGVTTLQALPWGSAIAADVYDWAKQQSLLGGTESGGSWTWSTDAAYSQEQSEVAAFIKKETANIKVKVDQVSTSNFAEIYGVAYDENNPEHVAKIGKYQTSVSTDNGTTWEASGEPFAMEVTDYTAGTGIDITNNVVSIDPTTVTYTAASGETEANLSITDGEGAKPITGNAIASIKSYVDAKAVSAGAVTISDATTTSGYLKSYTFTQNGSTIGTIDIPKDYLVKGAVLATSTDATTTTTGIPVGHKYIDFTINTVGTDGTESHIYLDVADLVDAYTANNQTGYVTVAIDGSNNITATADTETLTNAHNTQYSFISYSAASEGTAYGNGIAEVVSQTDSTTTVKVVYNSIPGWDDREFTVNTTNITPGTRYQLYENGEALQVWVEIGAVQSEAVDGLATAIDVKNYVDSAVSTATPNLTGVEAIEVGPGSGSGENTTEVSLKLDNTTQTTGLTQNSGLIQGENGLRINDELTWVFNCGGADNE